MDDSKTILRLFREGRHRMYLWMQKWIGRGVSDEPEDRCDPVDVLHIVNFLRAGLGFRLRHVDHGQAAHCDEGPGCRVVASCTSSGLRVVLERPLGQCCCLTNSQEASTRFWSVSSSSESLHDAGCSSLPELNQGLRKVVKEVVGQLHHILIELSNPQVVKEITARNLTTGSLQSLTPSPGTESMRRVSSSPILTKDNCSVWSRQGPSEGVKCEETAVSLEEFPSIPSTEISPIKGPLPKCVPTFRTSSPHSVQSSLEKLSLRSNSSIVDRLEVVHRELGHIISLTKGNSPNVMDKTKNVPRTPKATSDSIRKGNVQRLVRTSVSSRTPQKRVLQTPQTVSQERTTTIKAQSTVKKFLSGSKVKNPVVETQCTTSKATPIVAKRRIIPQLTQKLEIKQKVGQKKLAK